MEIPSTQALLGTPRIGSSGSVPRILMPSFFDKLPDAAPEVPWNYASADVPIQVRMVLLRDTRRPVASHADAAAGAVSPRERRLRCAQRLCATTRGHARRTERHRFAPGCTACGVCMRLAHRTPRPELFVTQSLAVALFFRRLADARRCNPLTPVSFFVRVAGST